MAGSFLARRHYHQISCQLHGAGRLIIDTGNIKVALGRDFSLERAGLDNFPVSMSVRLRLCMGLVIRNIHIGLLYHGLIKRTVRNPIQNKA